MIQLTKICIPSRKGITTDFEMELIPLEKLGMDLKTGIDIARINNIFSTSNKTCCLLECVDWHEPNPRLIVINPDGLATESWIVAQVIQELPVVCKFSEAEHDLDMVLGTVTHVSQPLNYLKLTEGSDFSVDQEFIEIKQPETWDEFIN